ncbi:MAG TPA: molybdenum ABC transporter ATP-binding protein [Phycisphaerae bacterium]|nr:molybdenum ABC transporter ATP-binding protein [Phycisphaerae bacterium]
MLCVSLQKQLESFTLRADLSLSARVTGLFGPSGSGKTTLLNCIAGLTNPNDGAIRVGDTDFFDSSKHINVACRQRQVGYVFQEGLLFDHLTVRQNLTYSRHHRTGPALEQVVEVLELERLLDRNAGKLSGGEARRVAIGRAILSAPRLLLLDEPLTGLDRRMSGKTLSYIRSVLDAFDMQTIYVSHSISDIVYLCDEVVVIDRGSVVGQGAPIELLGTMVSADRDPLPVLKNIFPLTILPSEADDGTVVGDLGEQTVEVGARAATDRRNVTAMVYARDIILANQKPTGLSARNVLCGKIVRLDADDGRCVASVDVGPHWMVEITRAAMNEMQLAVGSEVYVVVKASAIQLLENSEPTR